MPLVNVMIGLIVVGVPLWLVFVFVVVRIQSSDPGEAILVDERVAQPGDVIVYITGDEAGNRYHDSVSERRADFVADGQQSLGIQSSGISTVGQGELNPVASNGTEYGRQQTGALKLPSLPTTKPKKVAESGKLS